MLLQKKTCSIALNNVKTERNGVRRGEGSTLNDFKNKAIFHKQSRYLMARPHNENDEMNKEKENTWYTSYKYFNDVINI